MTKYKVSENFTLHSDENGYLLFDTINGSIYKLNEISFKIISLIDGNRTDQEIRETISSKYSVGIETINKDFDDLTKMLLDRHIIKK